MAAQPSGFQLLSHPFAAIVYLIVVMLAAVVIAAVYAVVIGGWLTYTGGRWTLGHIRAHRHSRR